MSDQMKKEIEAVVNDIFKSKEEAEMRKSAEEALKNSAATITQLTESLEAKEKELSKVEEELSLLKESVNGLEENNKTLASAKEEFDKAKADFEVIKMELEKRAETAESVIAEIKKEQLVKARMEELSAAGVSPTDDAQLNKIKEMSDEEFASFKTERESLRKSILAELAAVEAKKKEDATKTDDGVSPEVAAAKSKPAVDPGQAVAAMLNFDVRPDQTMIDKYKALGTAMAESIVGRNDKTKKSK